MLKLEAYSYHSKLNGLHPVQKLALALPPLLFGLWANQPELSCTILISMSALTVGFGKTAIGVWLKLMALPTLFLSFGLMGILLEFSWHSHAFLWHVECCGFFVGTNPALLTKAWQVGINALAGVSCLYFLVLTTPLNDLLRAFRQLKFPALLCELMGLMYHFIFLLIETAYTIHTAQISRLSNYSVKSQYQAFSTLVFRVFVRAHHLALAQLTALESRGYTGELNVLRLQKQAPVLGYVLPTLLYGLLLMVYFLINTQTGVIN